MKKWLAFVFVLLMVPVFCYSEGTEPFSFNGFTFKLSIDEVDQIAIEKGNYVAWSDGYGFAIKPWKVCQRYNAALLLDNFFGSLQRVMLGISTNPTQGAVPGFENDEISMEDYNYIRRAIIALYGEENPIPSELGVTALANTIGIKPSLEQKLNECNALFWEKENVIIFIARFDSDGDNKKDVGIYYMDPDFVKSLASSQPLEIDSDLNNYVPSWYAPLEETSEVVDTTGL